MAGFPGRYYVAGDIGEVSYNQAVGSLGTQSFPNPRIFRIGGGIHNTENQFGSITESSEWSYSMFSDSLIDYGAMGKESLSASSIQASLIFGYPINSKFDLTGKIGYINIKVESHSSLASTSNLNGSNSHLLFGIGMQYHINANYMVRTQVENFGRLERGGYPIKAYPISAGLVYEF